MTTSDLDKLHEYLLSSTLFLSLLGVLSKIVSSATSIRDALTKCVIGCSVAFVVNPIVKEYADPTFYPVLVFLIGYGGTEILELIKGVFTTSLRDKAEILLRYIIKDKTGGITWLK